MKKMKCCESSKILKGVPLLQPVVLLTNSILTWGRSHKTFFGVNLISLVCKLDLLRGLLDYSSLHKRASKFTPKKFLDSLLNEPARDQ